MYYNSNFGGQVQQPMPQQMPMYGQGPYPVMDNRLSALEMQMKQGQQNPNLLWYLVTYVHEIVVQ